MEAKPSCHRLGGNNRVFLMVRSSLKQHSQCLQSSLPPPNCIFKSAFLFAGVIYRLLKQALVIQKPAKKIICATDSISLLTQLAEELRVPLLPLGSREPQFRLKPNYERTIQANNKFQHTNTHLRSDPSPWIYQALLRLAAPAAGGINSNNPKNQHPPKAELTALSDSCPGTVWRHKQEHE